MNNKPKTKNDMSKKDFVKLAAAVKSEVDKYDKTSVDALDAVREVAESIANVCADSNGAFDKAHFVAACGFNS